MKQTKIDWCDCTVNPVVGCTNGCAYCTGCTVGVGVYFDGSYNKSPLQVVEKTVNWNYMQEVIARWGIMFFPTRELAEKALEEYDAIRSIKNCDQRIEEYEKWEAGADRRIKEATL